MRTGKYLCIFLLLVFAGEPFTNHVLEVTNVPRFLALNGLIALVAVVLLLRGHLRLKLSAWLLLATGALYVVFLASIGWSLNKADALYESQKVFSAIGVLVLIGCFINAENEEAALIKSLTVIAAIFVVCAFGQISQLPDLRLDTLYSVTGFSGHKTLLASLLFLLLAFSIYGICHFNGSWRIFSAALSTLIVFLLIFLQVRSVYLGGLCTATLLAFLMFRKSSRRLLLFLVSGLAALTLLAVAINPGLIQRLDVTQYAASNSGAERLRIWSKTLSLIAENAFLGVGAGNWQYNFQRFGVADIPNISLKDVSFQRPHNDLLWIASETGIAGLTITLLIIVLVAKKSTRSIKTGNTKAIIFFAFLAGLLVESLFSFPKERILHIVLASTLLALLVKQINTENYLPGINGKIICWLLLTGSAFSLIAGTFRLRGELYTRLLLEEKSAGKPATAAAFGLRAISAFYKTDPTSTPIASYLGWAYHEMGKWDSSLFYSHEAYLLTPYDHEVLTNYGLALERCRQTQEARVMLRRAITLNPYYEPARFNMFVLEYNARNYEDAANWLRTIPGYIQKYSSFHEMVQRKITNEREPGSGAKTNG